MQVNCVMMCERGVDIVDALASLERETGRETCGRFRSRGDERGEYKGTTLQMSLLMHERERERKSETVCTVVRKV